MYARPVTPELLNGGNASKSETEREREREREREVGRGGEGGVGGGEGRHCVNAFHVGSPHGPVASAPGEYYRYPLCLRI
jgi:hypothetical protein